MSDPSQTSLPTTKVARAARFAKTGFNVGTNYIQHYAKKAVGAESTTEDLHAANAAELLAQPDIDGGLIGGASLKAPDFLKIIAAAG